MLLLPLAHAESVPRPPMEMRVKDVELQMRDFSFPSGLRVIFQEDHSQPIVAVTTTVDRGSAADPEGLEGIAHCVEHLWFRSVHQDAEGKDLPKVWDILKEIGGNLNASTADDWTNYMTVASKEHLVTLMRLESLRLHDAVAGVDEPTLWIEREVIRNELRMRYENSWFASLSTVLSALYPPTHPYARLGIGTHDSLNAIHLSDVRMFAEKHYVPENTTITVVGDFSLADVGSLIAELRPDQLGIAPGAALPRAEPRVRVRAEEPPPEPPAPRLPVQVKGEVANLQYQPGSVEKRMLILAWTAPGAYHSTDFQMELASYYLRYALLQELYPSWQVGRELPAAAETFGCFPWTSKVDSKILCVLELEDGENERRTTERLLDGLYRMTSNDEETRALQQWFFTRALTEYKAQIFAGVDNVSALQGRATQISAWTHFTGDPRYFSTSFRYLSTINGDAVRAFASKYLTRARAVATVVEPYQDGDIDLTSSNSTYRGARRDDTFASILTEAEAEAKVEGTVVPPDRSKIRVSALDNGMELVAMPYSSSPLVQVAVRFPTGGGLSVEEARRLEYAATMSRSESYGVVDPLRFGGLESSTLDTRAWTFRITAPAGNVNDAAYVLRTRLDALIAYTDGKSDWVRAGKRAVLAWMKDPAAWAETVGMERLLPGHPASAWIDHAG